MNNCIYCKEQLKENEGNLWCDDCGGAGVSSELKPFQEVNAIEASAVDALVSLRDEWKIKLYEAALKRLTECPPIGLGFEYYTDIARNALKDGEG